MTSLYTAVVTRSWLLLNPENVNITGVDADLFAVIMKRKARKKKKRVMG